MAKKRKAPPARLWSIRMPEELLQRLEFGAKNIYGLPVQTYAKLIIEMGLFLEQKHGLMVMGTKADLEAAARRNREVLLEARKRAQKVVNGVHKNSKNEEASAAIVAKSSVEPLPVTTHPQVVSDDEDEVLADAGVIEVPPKDPDEELKNVLDTLL